MICALHNIKLILSGSYGLLKCDKCKNDYEEDPGGYNLFF